jgi:ribosomal protein S27E
MDDQIAQTPMPFDYRNTYMSVLCNDCLEKSIVKFHIMGGKCQNCRSYNTTQTGGLFEQEPKETN